MDRYYPIILIVLLSIAAKLCGVSLFYVLTESMKPAAGKGDAVITVPVRKVKIGDIISFEQTQSVITHRVISIHNETGGTYFITKGDNNTYDDPFPVSGKEILGKVIFVIPSGKIINIHYVPVLYWLLGFTFGILIYTLRVQKAPQL
ncbi:MAG: Signal sequence peptidase [candidate division WWE3 bacterium GW2011_GWD2_42_11]|uniref:Signal peptidase I n=2 Tax=Katanobacteria TaxID=422282 RepID=A0A1F4VZD0_UNCKA|nr:MAG: Signal sequence peptidase [candidate division WWE3 bacterium GW2011_GWC2_41_23]KKS26932.1 MAG: Signal sequence peptidase [candidate division WWE3 bacterium GW2011_GWC1_42_102]KKS28682.1 MAG: Signal sequence peptidase [candidate division WWE3 bacterium GW2011_GWD2_42_11]KKS40968.1 MAG: Signal sequence peptidase [candidate division WWE3 bacterium GW2011_GWE1_42_16]KKS51296.1 MAG: Signal sequence peptidase [candidate division WWE3 bacterium GW2011_GWE2_42_25]KKS60624.1 MAG: Signal sequenc